MDIKASAHSQLIFRLLVVGSALLPGAIISAYLFPRALPWWLDGGNWLKHMHAIQGNTYPMWGEGSWQYPPLFSIILAGLSGLVADEILALKVGAVLVFSLRPLTTYFFVRELFHDRVAGLAAAWLAGFAPIFIEMMGWGGYPNLLAVSILPLAYYGIVRYSRSSSLKSLVILVSFSALIPLAHHLTFLVFVGSLVAWAFLSAIFDRGSLKAQVLALAGSLSAFALYRLVSGPSQFLLFNEAAFYHLTFTIESGLVLWMFKNAALFVLLYLAVISSVFLLLFEKGFRRAGLLLASWGVIPILLTQGYLAGLSLDYARIFFFMAQPFMILAAAPFAFRNEVTLFVSLGGFRSAVREFADLLKFGGGRVSLNPLKHVLAFVVLILASVSVLVTPFVGAAAVRNVDLWYNGRDAYGDQEKLDVAKFIALNSPRDAVILAEDSMGRWIEGYAQRRVLFHHDPMFLFMQGELEREYVARAILLSNFGIRDGYAWVLDQAPYGIFAPIISLFMRGDYFNVVYLNESSTSVEWVDISTDVVSNRTLKEATSRNVFWVERSSQRAVLGVEYDFGSVRVVRQVAVEASDPKIVLSFRVDAVSEGVILQRLSVALDKWEKRVFFEARLLSDRIVRIETDVGRIYLSSSSDSAFPFVFKAARLSQKLEGWISVWSVGKPNDGGLLTYDRLSLVQQYGVQYLVVPKRYVVPVNQKVSIGLHSLDFYDNLLADPLFQIVHANDRALILSTRS